MTRQLPTTSLFTIKKKPLNLEEVVVKGVNVSFGLNPNKVSKETL
jgi:hypothetical protein